MAGFERGSPGIGNNRAVNCATASAHLLLSRSLLLTEKKFLHCDLSRVTPALDLLF